MRSTMRFSLSMTSAVVAGMYRALMSAITVVKLVPESLQGQS